MSAPSASAASAPPRAPVYVFGFDVAPHIEKLPPALRPAAQTALTAQFAWFVGHLLTVVQTLLFIVFRRNSPAGASSFRWALLGTVLSYAIVLYKAHVFEALVKDENAQYGMLAVAWLWNPAYTPLLIPYLTFSLFHVATYTHKSLVKLLPASLHSLAPPLKSFVDNYQQPALNYVAYYEAAVLPLALLIGIFPRWVRILSPLVYGQFLLQRYRTSGTTKRAFRSLRLTADKYLDVPTVPQGARNAYLAVRSALEKLGGPRAAETPQGATSEGPAASAGADKSQ
ncbi:hypothetical protein DFJ74DRAFT_357342 [Hyaloraphidium curvatum]|nr:hypothetical protein DFJ74DRAFT_357342 [Hyaloraphidium curvatum]